MLRYRCQIYIKREVNILKKKVLIILLALILGASMTLVGCGNGEEPEKPAGPQEPAAPAGPGAKAAGVDWLLDYVNDPEPLIFKEPFLEIIGQIDGPIPYYYSEVVKLAGHSCGATAGAWVLVKKAMEALYGDETPVRGDIKITMPGPPDQYYIGVFGEIFTYLTGAAPESGFPGTAFPENANRRNKMIYPDEPTADMFPLVNYIFERVDTGKKVAVGYNLGMVKPASSDEMEALQAELTAGTISDEDRATWTKWWNDRAENAFINHDQPGFFRVQILD